MSNYHPVFIPLIVMAVLLVAIASTYGIVNSQTANGKYDSDGDGLIEIEYFEQLNAVRYDLNGDGGPDDDSGTGQYASAFPTGSSERVCERSCWGYELTRSLVFGESGSYASGSVNTSWTTGRGWLPIGIGERPFNAIFEGNGYTISTLYINRTTAFDDPGTIGLFGVTSASSLLKNSGLVGLDITGNQFVGGFVGWNGGTISESYSDGRVVGQGGSEC